MVLFLFVIMFLGVDREENIAAEPLRGQRPLAIALVLLGHDRSAAARPGVEMDDRARRSVAGPRHRRQTNVDLMGKSLYTTYLFPFEATSALLIIAVVGAVVLARRPPSAARSDRRPS